MKKIAPIIEFALSLLFFGVIPYILFFETFPVKVARETSTSSLISFGAIVGLILVFICLKRFVINPYLKDMNVRIGILKDKAATESDIEIIIKCHRRIALFKNFQTLISMIVPVLAVVLTILFLNNTSTFITKVCKDLSEAQTYIKRLNYTVSLASTSFAIGVLLQFIFPWIQLHAVKKGR